MKQLFLILIFLTITLYFVKISIHQYDKSQKSCQEIFEQKGVCPTDRCKLDYGKYEEELCLKK